MFVLTILLLSQRVGGECTFVKQKVKDDNWCVCCPPGWTEATTSATYATAFGTSKPDGNLKCRDARKNDQKIYEHSFGCQKRGTTTQVVEWEEKRQTDSKEFNILADEDSYVAVLKVVRCHDVTDWGPTGGGDEMNIELKCGDKTVKHCNMLKFNKGDTATHPEDKQYAFCGVASIDCKAKEDLTVKLIEKDHTQADTSDEGVASIPWNKLERWVSGHQFQVVVGMEGLSAYDVFWDTFWTFQEEVCVTDLIPYGGKVLKAAKVSAKTLKRMKKVKKAVEAAEKAKSLAETSDFAQCDITAECKEANNAVDLKVKCEGERSNCMTGEESAKDWVDKVWSNQCLKPPEDGSKYSLEFQFFADSKLKSSYTVPTSRHDVDSTDFVDCSKCPSDKTCKDKESKPNYTATQRRGTNTCGNSYDGSGIADAKGKGFGMQIQKWHLLVLATMTFRAVRLAQ